MVLLVIYIEVYIICYKTSLQLQFYAAVILSCCNQILLQIFWVPYCYQSTTIINTYRHYPPLKLIGKKKDNVALLFKWMMIMIRFFIWNKKGPLFLFQDFLNVNIMQNLLNFMVRKLSCCIIYHTSILFSYFFNFGCKCLSSLLCIYGETLLIFPWKIPHYPTNDMECKGITRVLMDNY